MDIDYEMAFSTLEDRKVQEAERKRNLMALGRQPRLNQLDDMSAQRSSRLAG
jgi:hypothetical protein